MYCALIEFNYPGFYSDWLNVRLGLSITKVGPRSYSKVFVGVGITERSYYLRKQALFCCSLADGPLYTFYFLLLAEYTRFGEFRIKFGTCYIFFKVFKYGGVQFHSGYWI